MKLDGEYLQALREEARDRKRRAARANLLDFTRFTKDEFEENWHHKVICYYLEKVISREITRFMLNIPPRHTKSELVSRRLPAYVLGRNPDEEIIACSYGDSLASAFNRDVQRIIDSDSYRELFPDTCLSGKNIRTAASGSTLRNNDIFEIVGRNGKYRSAGVGSGITGQGFGIGIADDPIKDYKDASSPTVRKALRDWYDTTFLTREAKNGAIIICQTRWNKDDLSGQLLDLAASDPEADQFVVLSLPAICEKERELPEEIYDELRIEPRKVGEALWPSRYPISKLAKRRASSPQKFKAVYQQSPTTEGGTVFQVGNISIVQASPAKFEKVIRYWDKAGTQGGDGAETAGVRIGLFEGRYYVTDVRSGRWSALEREKTMKQTAILDGVETEIWVEQEPGSGGKESAERTIQNLAGFNIYADRVTGSKEDRADPFSAQVEAGNVILVAGAWNAGYISQLEDFPNGKYKDKVDASSGAFNKLTLGDDFIFFSV